MSAQPTLRADARRNVEKLRAAAVEVFRERGLHAPLEEIAQRAGVSAGTLYNRFGGREALIDAVVPELAAARLGEVADRALRHPDPWEGFALYVEEVCQLQATDRALSDVISRRYADTKHLAAVCEHTLARERQIIERAQRAGSLRPDFTPEDLLFVFWSTAMLVSCTGHTAPDAWRRNIAFMLDGLRAGAAHPLPVGPLTRDQAHRAMLELGR
jgi:AcrR family transcriptional regulator